MLERFPRLRGLRLLLGINVLWLPLSMLFDGLNALILPQQLIGAVSRGNQATVLGLLTFFGLLAGMLIQPLAGMFSDRLRPSRGRQRFIGAGVLFILITLLAFALFSNLPGLILGYLFIQLAAGVTQAGQQGLIPDLVSPSQRGMASGIKGFMDIGGAMIGFLLIGQLLGNGSTVQALGVIGISLMLAYLFARVLVPEDRLEALEGKVRSPERYPSLRQAFRLDLRQHRPFAWLVFSRFLFLLATYAIGRFLLYFIAGRMGLDSNQAAEQAGSLLAGLALVTVLASPLAGWAADRFGRVSLMTAGALLSAVGVLLLITATSAGQILLFGAFMSLGSAAFAGASWAMTADLVPPDEAARFFGLANFGTAGAAAAAGLFGPLVDLTNRISPGAGYPILFILSAILFLVSALVLRRLQARSMQPQSEAANLQNAYQPLSPMGSEKAEKY